MKEKKQAKEENQASEQADGKLPTEEQQDEFIQETPDADDMAPDDFDPKSETEEGEDITKETDIDGSEAEIKKEQDSLNDIDDDLEKVNMEIDAQEDDEEEGNKLDASLDEDIEKDMEEAKLDDEIIDDEKDLKEVDQEIAKIDEEITEALDEEQAEENNLVEKEDDIVSNNKDKMIKKDTVDDLPKEELSDVDETEELIKELKEEKPVEQKEAIVEKEDLGQNQEITTHIYGLRTTANREDQVMDFITSNAEKKGFNVYSVIRAHGMRGYIFVEAETRSDAEQAAFNVPYARGVLPKEIEYHEIEHMLEQVKKEVNMQQNDIVEIISGPFKRENAKIIRLDKSKEEVVVELLEAAVPIPITLKLDSVKVIRRESGHSDE
jgi:transcription termination/antitermination protein NusG